MDHWSFEKGSSTLRHQSGKYFSIEDIQIDTNWDRVKHWTQPLVKSAQDGIIVFSIMKIRPHSDVPAIIALTCKNMTGELCSHKIGKSLAISRVPTTCRWPGVARFHIGSFF